MKENKDNLVKAVIEEALPALKFKAKSESGEEILVHLAGRLRIHRIRVVAGDTVMVETSPYDRTRGRIIRRL